MKKGCTFFLLIISIFISCQTSAQEQKSTAAVMDLEAKEGVSIGVASMLSDYLRTQLVNTQKITIVTRENMEQVLKEQQFQMSGCTSKECIIQVGQLLGVRKMITGSIGKLGTTYLLSLKIIDVQSGEIEKAETEECAKCEEQDILVSIRTISQKIVGLAVSGIERISDMPREQAAAAEPVTARTGNSGIGIGGGYSAFSGFNVNVDFGVDAPVGAEFSVGIYPFTIGGGSIFHVPPGQRFNAYFGPVVTYWPSFYGMSFLFVGGKGGVEGRVSDNVLLYAGIGYEYGFIIGAPSWYYSYGFFGFGGIGFEAGIRFIP